ncbi:hypothetical protein [Leptothoe sp. PORK10 BA2]|uniref:hypothetical protein n=1 Tax=Leptothoe sp. PORK10 BA2 TaxID=3110254 RepID=UPI002B20684E|nr:hypothetical protein [Leptothoe sp. PORK10 BA2]MEA5464868.1 hypothetical protein [Leptothoe sp. PORK10 BA2]
MQLTAKPAKPSKADAEANDSGQLGLKLEVYQVDPLGSWYGSKACHVFVTANGAAAMG